jgi:uncharacterized membrane protein
MRPRCAPPPQSTSFSMQLTIKPLFCDFVCVGILVLVHIHVLRIAECSVEYFSNKNRLQVEMTYEILLYLEG